MPAPPLANTFEGGTDAVAISAANSGSTSGDAFSSVDGTLALYSNVQTRGTMAMRVVDAAANARCNWTALGSITTSVWFRTYLYISAFPTTNPAWVISSYSSASANSCFIVINPSTGFIQMKNAAASSVAASIGTVAVPTGSWFRLEARILASTTVGEAEWKWWSDPDSTEAPSDTKSVTGQVLAANTDQARFGLTGTFPAAPFTIYLDDLAVSTAGWIGPVGVSTKNVSTPMRARR